MTDKKTPNISAQLEHCSNLKQNILDKIKEVDTAYNKTNDELLAEVFNNFYNTDTYSADSVSNDFTAEEKLDYINTFSGGNEDIQKKIKANSDIYEKEKAKIKNTIIGLLKLLGKVYNLNQNIISSLEDEIIRRKKESCKLNEAITVGKQEVETLKTAYEEKKQTLQEFQGKRNEVKNKLNDCDARLASATPEERKALENEQYNLIAEISSLDLKIDDLSIDIAHTNDKYVMAKNDLHFNEMELDSLNIEMYEQKLNDAKEGNEKLRDNIEQDRNEFAEIGFDISEKDIIDSNSTHQQSSNEPSKDKDASTQPKVAAQQQASQVQPQPQNLPTPQTPAQRARNLRDKILGSSNQDAISLLGGNDYSDMLSSLDSYNNKDKKALFNKINNLSTPLDMTRLSNVVSAIQKSGFCSGLNLQSLTANGKLKDFSQLSNSDIDNLNKFITEVEQNKDFIDDEQLDFLQNNFISNVKCNALSSTLKPKGFRDFFKSKTSREKDKVHTAKISNLSNALSCITTKKEEAPSRNSNFFNTLTGNTRDTIETPINTRTQTNNQPTR